MSGRFSTDAEVGEAVDTFLAGAATSRETQNV
jgi:hypothetical protein